MKQQELKYLDQDNRIKKCIGRLKDEMEILANWETYLQEKLNFPFQAEVVEYQESKIIRAGDKLKVIKIDNTDDLYGILVEVRLNRKKYIFPLCDLEHLDLSDIAKEALDDYRTWFSNR